MHDSYLQIELIDEKRTKKTFSESICKHQGTIFYSQVGLFIRHALHLQSTDAIVIVARYIGNTDDIVEYIKINNISKLYFFVEDIFRLYIPDQPHSCIDRSLIERYPNTVEALELNVIKKILEGTSLAYEIYHNEYNAGFFEKKYNLKIKYFDIFTATEALRWQKYSISFSFKYSLCCFNLRRQIERFYIVMLLSNFPNTLLTLGDRFNLTEVLADHVMPVKKFRSDIQLAIFQQLSIVTEKNIKFEWDVPFDDKELLKNISHKSTIHGCFDSFLTVVTETCFSSNLPNIGEKTIKPIIACRPFVMIAPCGTLSFLKKIGFNTFSNWWDESYDLIEDHHARFEAVHDVIINLLKKDKTELEKILEEMTPLLLQNKENLKKISANMFLINQIE